MPYDGDGNRVSQTVPSGTYQYLNETVTSLPVVLNENGPDGPIAYAYGLSMLSARGNGFEHFYQFDGLGSVVNLTDATGALRANYLYDPWGRLLNPVDPLGGRNKYKFTGEAFDSTGHLFLRARYYDHSVGRFLSREDASKPLLTPNAMHLFAYVENNPARFADPSGHTATEPQTSQNLPDGVFLVDGKYRSIGYFHRMSNQVEFKPVPEAEDPYARGSQQNQ